MPIVLDGTSGITTPDLTDSSLTANRVVYAGTGGNLTGASTFIFDGSNLGLGTNSPTGKLSIASTSSTAGTVSAWSNAYSIFGPNVGSSTGAALGLGYNTTADQSEIISLAPNVAWKPLLISSTGLIFASSNGSEAARFNSSGYLGIGTNSPASPLDIRKSISSNNVAYIANTNTNVGTSFGLKVAAGTNSSDYAFGADNAAATVALFRINGDGTVKTKSTIGVGDATPSSSGAGITFPATQSASSDANTLDDYEEGTWSPTYRFSTSGNASTVSAGRYIKIGSSVWVQGYLYINSSTACSGDATITGLPFTSNATGQIYYGFAIGVARRFNTDMPNFRIALVNNTTVLSLFKQATNGANETPLTNADFNVQAEYNILYFQGTYSV